MRKSFEEEMNYRIAITPEHTVNMSADEIRAALAARTINKETLVWREGMDQPAPLRSLGAELGSPVASRTVEFTSPEDQRTLRLWTWIIGGAIVLALGAMITLAALKQ